MVAQMNEGPVRFNSGKAKRDTAHDVVPFYLGDDDTVLTALRPKTAILIDLAAVLIDDSDEIRQITGLGNLLAEILDDDSYAHLAARLRDRDDALDLDDPDLIEALRYLVGLWYGRPIGKRAGSSSQPAPTGKRSTVRRRSKG